MMDEAEREIWRQRVRHLLSIPEERLTLWEKRFVFDLHGFLPPGDIHALSIPERKAIEAILRRYPMESRANDFRIIEHCAHVMGYATRWASPEHLVIMGVPEIYDPLRNDAQAMALVRKLHMWICGDDRDGTWRAQAYETPSTEIYIEGRSIELRRAICECAANFQQKALRP